MRAGIGFDAHPFEKERVLMLGGVAFDGDGLAGWSDGDVVIHAAIDAVLGAAGLGDIGTHFDASTVTQGESSVRLLEQTASLIGRHGFAVVNLDVTVIVQSVRIGGRREEMEKRIAGALGISLGAVNVKGTTTDMLGFTGREEGAAALAIALVTQSQDAV